MSTVTPSRPAPSRPGPSRSRTSAGAARSTGIDPFRVLRRHLLGIITAMIVGAALGVAAHFLFLEFYPLYTAQVLFEVQAGVRDVQDIGTQQTIGDADVATVAKTEMALMLSRDVLQAAVTNRDVQEKTIWFRSNFTDENGQPEVQEAVDALEEELGTGVVRGSKLFELTWSSHAPEDARIVLNAVADAYIAQREDMDRAVFSDNLKRYQDELESTRLNLTTLNGEIAEFIRKHGIESLQGTEGATEMLEARTLAMKIAEANSDLNVYMTMFEQTRAKLEGTLEPTDEDIREAEMDYAVANHVQTVESLKLQWSSLRERYKDDHGSVVRAEKNLRAAEAQLKAKRDEVIRRNLRAKIKIVGDQIESLRNSLEELEQRAKDQSTKVAELASNQAEFDSMQTQRTFLEQSINSYAELMKEIRIMRVRQDAQRVRVYQRALTPRELSFPRLEIVIPLGVLIVLALTVGGIFLRELTDQRVKAASDLQVLPGADVLGVVPDVDEDPTRIRTADLAVQEAPHSVIAESYRQTCALLARGVDTAGHQTIVFLSGMPSAGTTTVLGNVAAVAAGAGRRVLVVDANFRRPRLSAMMGVEGERPGLGDLITDDETSVDDVIVESASGIHVLPAGTPSARIIERIDTERFDEVVAELRSRYDLILFDAPPAVVAGEPLVLAHRLDAAVLVVRANQEHRGLVGRLIRQLEDARCDLLGLILNRARGTAGGYFKKNFAAMAKYAKPAS